MLREQQDGPLTTRSVLMHADIAVERAAVMVGFAARAEATYAVPTTVAVVIRGLDGP